MRTIREIGINLMIWGKRSTVDKTDPNLWILFTGFWRDTGYWIDTSLWID